VVFSSPCSALKSKKHSRTITRATRQGWNDPTVGDHGLVYIASQVWQRGGSAAILTYAHELGNILDEKLYPDTKDSQYGMHHGIFTPDRDPDTGQRVEDCMKRKMK
jgi:hypothetical protein